MSDKLRCTLLRNQLPLYIISLFTFAFLLIPSNVIAANLLYIVIPEGAIHYGERDWLDTVIKLLQIPVGLCSLILTILLTVVNHDKVVRLFKKGSKKQQKEDDEPDCV